MAKDESRYLVRVEEKLDRGMALIHYKGWRKSFDEIVPCTSLRPKPDDDICNFVRNAQLPSEEEERAFRQTLFLFCCLTFVCLYQLD